MVDYHYQSPNLYMTHFLSATDYQMTINKNKSLKSLKKYKVEHMFMDISYTGFSLRSPKYNGVTKDFRRTVLTFILDSTASLYAILLI